MTPVAETDPGPPATADAVAAESVAEAVAAEFEESGRSPESPEARRELAKRLRKRGLRGEEAGTRQSLRELLRAVIGPGTRSFIVIKRVAIGTYFDGFIHAGNLAYLALIALFPFFITATALMSAFGQTQDGVHALEVVLDVMPPNVAATLDAPVREVLTARTGPLLWLGALVGLWTVGSLIETIRDILRRAYGTTARKSFFHYRFYSILIIVGAVLLLLLSFSLQVVTVGVQEFIQRLLPAGYAGWGAIGLSRAISGAGLFLSLYFLFLSLTPQAYRSRAFPKWPGALLTTLWWIGVTIALPPLLAGLLSYDMTYGSLAGVMVVLFFFYLIGLGVVIGAELNAALAESPEEAANRIGQADNRAKQTQQGSAQ